MLLSQLWQGPLSRHMETVPVRACWPATALRVEHVDAVQKLLPSPGVLLKWNCCCPRTLFAVR